MVEAVGVQAVPGAVRLIQRREIRLDCFANRVVLLTQMEKRALADRVADGYVPPYLIMGGFGAKRTSLGPTQTV